MNKTYKTNYLAKNFSSIKEELKQYAKRYYPDTLGDLSDANINSFLIESVAYVGDILSYYLDYQTNETFLATAIERKNIVNLANSLGYKHKKTSSTVGKVALYMLVPASSSGTEPDYSSVPSILKGTILESINGNKFITTEDIKIDSNSTGVMYTPARTNTYGNITFFAVKTYLPVISGFTKTVDIPVGDFIKFKKIYLQDFSTVEVISVTDSENNKYHEVSNLSQNIVYTSVFNADSEVKYSLKPISAQRRFVFGYEENIPYLMFGGTRYKPDEDLTVDPITEPSKFILNKYNNDYLHDEFFEPNKLLNGDNYGISPENTTLSITYRTNVSDNNNANIGDISSVYSLNTKFENENISESTKNIILNSIQVSNEEPLVGENTEILVDEIKNLAGIIYSSQNRAVTAKDYEAITYMMPQKYGAIKRCRALRDPTSTKNNLNLYIVCSDRDSNLTKSNTKIKENLKYWLTDYKILTDTVDILDAKIINFSLDYVVKIDPYADRIEAINKINYRLQSLFSNKPQIGESMDKLDIFREIRKIRDVLDIVSITIKNKTGGNYSSIPFNIEQNTTSDGNVIKIPKNAIYEVKDLIKDINGKAI